MRQAAPTVTIDGAAGVGARCWKLRRSFERWSGWTHFTANQASTALAAARTGDDDGRRLPLIESKDRSL